MAIKSVKIIQKLWGFVEILLGKLAPLADLAARLYIANIFFLAGKNKFQDWAGTLDLFRYEYHVPLVSPEFAAVSGTAGELTFSVLLALGLFTRFSACGLFVLNIVAFFSYYETLIKYDAAVHDHIEWGLILALLIVTNVRALTLDNLVLRRLLKK